MAERGLKIPSPIDVHVHLREPGTNTAETIESGTRAALAGGYQAVFDMPNNPGAPTWSRERLEEKEAIARRTALTDIGFYAGIDLANPAMDEIPRMVGRAAGLKLYMDHTTGNVQKHDLASAKPVIDAWISAASEQQVKAPILLHARESIGAETAEYIASQGHHAHWCHVATATEAVEAKNISERHSEYFTAGVTPHHLTMTARNADFQQGWNARMQPPLGREADAQALLDGFNERYLHILETDHAPHDSESKSIAEHENPSGKLDKDCTTCFGVSGIEFVLPVMMSLVARDIINMRRLVDALHYEPARMLGMKKGSAALRAVTHLELTERPYVISEIDVTGSSTNTPYINWMAHARVVGLQKSAIEPIVSVKTASRENRDPIVYHAQYL